MMTQTWTPIIFTILLLLPIKTFGTCEPDGAENPTSPELSQPRFPCDFSNKSTTSTIRLNPETHTCDHCINREETTKEKSLLQLKAFSKNKSKKRTLLLRESENLPNERDISKLLEIGVEDSYANALTGILDLTRICDAVDQFGFGEDPKEIKWKENSQIQAILRLLINTQSESFSKKAWEKLKKNLPPKDRKIITLLDSLRIESEKVDDAYIQNLVKIYHSDLRSESAHLRDLSGTLLKMVLDENPAFKKEFIATKDSTLIDTYAKPGQKSLELTAKLYDLIALKARNKLLIRNIATLYCEAAPFNIDLAFVVGCAHTEEIYTELQEMVLASKGISDIQVDTSILDDGCLDPEGEEEVLKAQTEKIISFLKKFNPPQK